ncbi:bifunctional aspartokinase/homoserine dehydrogenase I [Artemisia annua]|uniref:Bifunctional aspartokinase/homoserine dehydrogenase I n=1 Tax=Artemisia annua TaxID=35608 RepID=A0A2U1LRV8_ARTAN|nr:bifunctional aspartokinase/homoserine dehydrogenase I [Artemisia annua]
MLQVIILARECGLNLELSDIPVQSLVPDPLKETASADDFMQQLPSFDADFAAKRKAAEDAGEVLRYVGVVDVKNQEGTVELRRYNKQHPFAQLSGSDNIIAFTTERYNKQPLIVRGLGAGAEVTAGGVFSDLLRLASNLGAHHINCVCNRVSSVLLFINKSIQVCGIEFPFFLFMCSMATHPPGFNSLGFESVN